MAGFFAFPLARIVTQSLVLLSPSTVIRLNDRFVASFKAIFRVFASMTASVNKNPSMVAILGWIMPEPLVIPPIEMFFPLNGYLM